MRNPPQDDVHTLRFTGLRHRKGPLTWSQRSMWNNIQRLKPDDRHLNQLLRLTLPEAVPVERVSQAVRELLGRHEALRTTYSTDARGTPVQQVQGAGEVTLAAYRREPGTDAAETWPPSLTERFELDTHLPLRVALGLHDGMVCNVVLCLSHLATDAYSNRILRDELRTLLTAGSDPRRLLEPPTAQPLDLASEQQESSPERLAATYAYWRELMASAARTRFDAPTGAPMSPRFWHGEYSSQEMFEASSAVAKHARISEAAVLLAAMFTPLGGELRQTRLPVWLRAGNRFRPETRRSVTYLCQNVPMMCEVGPAGFRDAAVQAHRSMMRASRHSSYDPDRVAGLAAPGAPFPSVTYNAIGRHGPARSVAGDRFRWIEKLDHEGILIFANVFMGSSVSLLADSALLPPDRLHTCLRETKHILVSANREC